MGQGIDDYLTAHPGATAADLDGLPRTGFTVTLDPAALHGLPGRIVETIDPYTEADPIATLAHVLVATGNMIGPGPHALVQADRHPCRLNAVLVGTTSKGRKGTAWSTPRALLAAVDEEYVCSRVRAGLSSGEGIIFHVRDAREETQPIKERGRVTGSDRVVVDEGETDKRLLLIEPELASVLRRMRGEGNTLSSVLREAWDSGNLSTLTRNSPLRATGAHVSVVGHITAEELRAELTELDRANGFANRFLFFLVRRSKVLPEGAAPPLSVLSPLIAALHRAVEFARSVGEVPRDPVAKALWATVYPELSEGEPGLVGAVLSRAEAQVLRLSVLYAVLDCSPVVRPAHLRAALAVWEAAELSARRIFGDALGLPVADVILSAIRQKGSMTGREIHGLFHNHRSAAQIGEAIARLARLGLIRRKVAAAGEEAAGRPALIWEVVPRDDSR